MVHRWSQIVVEELDQSGNYPSFLRFTEFMQREAKIINNPFAFPFWINMKTTDETFPKLAKILNTSTQLEDPNLMTHEKPKPPCLFCKNEAHVVAKCPTFAAKPIDEKRAFVFEHHLCFGCYRKGHASKDCKKQHTFKTCGWQNPTCLHKENIKPSA